MRRKFSKYQSESFAPRYPLSTDQAFSLNIHADFIGAQIL